jgi:uncharacterized 2Fe-2S/4Fe-4S cluster protein (DUF4445 family)
MSDKITIRLHPLGKSIKVDQGVPLRDVLFDFGVEFPCGGHGRCRACRVRLLEGRLEADSEQRSILGNEEIGRGWRLACRCCAESDAVLEIGQWDTAILSDESRFEFTPLDGFGIAVDLGTTTMVAQLVDLSTARILGVQSSLNPQAAHGSDVMSRIQLATSRTGLSLLRDSVRDGVGRLIDKLLDLLPAAGGYVRKVVIVGNSAMHHLFCGINPTPLAFYPFEYEDGGLKNFLSSSLGWRIPGEPMVYFLPCIGGFVGSDILAGIMAAGLDVSPEITGLVDLGTNGEVVFGDRGRLYCASTAAGPAFEGARIRSGMRASTGAISAVRLQDGRPVCAVIGGGAPRGICGSGLVDAVSVGLDLKIILTGGRLLRDGAEWVLEPPVSLVQNDIRELQLAKGAIAAAIRLLLDRCGANTGSLRRVQLAGAFGNYIDKASARRIGLLDFAPEQIVSAGNTALHGAKMALFDEMGENSRMRRILDRLVHVPLAADPHFEEIYVESMVFPE